MATVFASLDVTAEGSGAAVLDCRHDLQLLQAQMAGMVSPVCGAGSAEDIGNLDRGTHGFIRRARSLWA